MAYNCMLRFQCFHTLVYMCISTIYSWCPKVHPTNWVLLPSLNRYRPQKVSGGSKFLTWLCFHPVILEWTQSSLSIMLTSLACHPTQLPFLTLSLLKAPDIKENYRRQECHKVSFKLQLTLIILSNCFLNLLFSFVNDNNWKCWYHSYIRGNQMPYNPGYLWTVHICVWSRFLHKWKIGSQNQWQREHRFYLWSN